jgi:hypothetical protein
MDNCGSKVVMLASNENSCVIRCGCCDSYQVSFKNFIINFKHEQYEKFTEIIMNNSLLYSDEPTYNNKRAMIKCTSEADIYLAFDSGEIEELKELLEDAVLLDEACRSVNLN